MTSSWLSSMPVQLMEFVSGALGIIVIVWAVFRWARTRVREWCWARYDTDSPASPFSSAATFDLEEFKRAYGLPLPGDGSS